MMENILAMRLNKRGSRTYGPKNKLMVHLPSGIGVDIFSTDEECWPVSLVVRTGGETTNKRIAMAAIRKNCHGGDKEGLAPQGLWLGVLDSGWGVSMPLREGRL